MAWRLREMAERGMHTHSHHPWSSIVRNPPSLPPCRSSSGSPSSQTPPSFLPNDRLPPRKQARSSKGGNLGMKTRRGRTACLIVTLGTARAKSSGTPRRRRFPRSSRNVCLSTLSPLVCSLGLNVSLGSSHSRFRAENSTVCPLQRTPFVDGP